MPKHIWHDTLQEYLQTKYRFPIPNGEDPSLAAQSRFAPHAHAQTAVRQTIGGLAIMENIRPAGQKLGPKEWGTTDVLQMANMIFHILSVCQEKNIEDPSQVSWQYVQAITNVGLLPTEPDFREKMVSFREQHFMTALDRECNRQKVAGEDILTEALARRRGSMPVNPLAR